MPDDNTPTPNELTITDGCCLLVGLALGVGFGTLIHIPAAGIGTGVVMGVASNMARRRGSQHWMGWLGLYAVIILVAYALRLTEVLK